MAIYQKYLKELWPKIPTIWRRWAGNVLNITQGQYNAGMDAVAQALVDFIEDSYPLTTASGWMLDSHWGPYVNVDRNGGTDDQFRLFIRAKRLLNRSWGAADQALVLFELLLPGATLVLTMQYPKAWTISIGGVDMAAAAQAIAFMTKKESPLGGGFSVAGDNGLAKIADDEAFNYSSIYGTNGVEYEVTGWYTSEYWAGNPPVDAGTAGYAHVAQI